MPQSQSRRGRPPIPEFWVRLIEQVAVDFPDKSAAEIARQVAEQAKASERTDYPRDRRVREIVAGIRGAEEEVKQPYRYLRWPDSFESGALPWEAAPGLLAEVQYRRRWGGAPAPMGELQYRRAMDEVRPRVGWAQWWWIIRRSAPSMDDELVRDAANQLASMAVLGSPPSVVMEQVEDWITGGAWEVGEPLQVTWEPDHPGLTLEQIAEQIEVFSGTAPDVARLLARLIMQRAEREEGTHND